MIPPAIATDNARYSTPVNKSSAIKTESAQIMPKATNIKSAPSKSHVFLIFITTYEFLVKKTKKKSLLEFGTVFV